MDTAQQAHAVAAPVKAYFAGLNAHDVDAVMSAFAHDAVLMANEVESSVGSTEVRAAYAHRFTLFDYARHLHIDDWFADGALAVVRCHTTGSFTMKATETKIDAVSRELFVLNHVDGQWKIRCYMFNRPASA